MRFKRFKLVRRIRPNEWIPLGFGVAWEDYHRQECVLLPWGLNFLAALARWLYWVIAAPRAVLERISIAKVSRENDHLRASIESLERNLRVTSDDLDRAVVIIDRLPRTDDGAVVVPGEIYHAVATWADSDDPPVVIPVKWVGHAAPWIDFTWANVDDGSNVEEFMVVSVYRSPVAARRAADRMGGRR